MGGYHTKSGYINCHINESNQMFKFSFYWFRATSPLLDELLDRNGLRLLFTVKKYMRQASVFLSALCRLVRNLGQGRLGNI